MKILKILLLLLLSPSFCLAWVLQDRLLFKQRKFIELETNLIFQKRFKEAQQIKRLAEVFPGCQKVHEGMGRADSLLNCIKFLKLEKAIKIPSPKRNQVVQDMNLVCVAMAENKDFIKTVLQQGIVLKDEKEWKPCQSAVWKQIYLSTYAKFQADPVGTLSLVRTAESKLGVNQPWTSKTRRLFASP
jgi:hypothetical protein